jgi:hypothetical protein
MDPETTPAPVTAPEPPVTAPVTEPTEAEKAEALRKAEIDRYRNEAGQAAKKAKDLEAELQKLRDEKLTETERLQKTAEQVPTLTSERDTWKERAEKAETEIASDVEARKKALPAEIACLLPEGTPSQQLAWIRTAEASAAKLKPANGLPPAGGRNPGGGQQNGEPTEQERQAHAQNLASRF